MFKSTCRITVTPQLHDFTVLLFYYFIVCYSLFCYYIIVISYSLYRMIILSSLPRLHMVTVLRKSRLWSCWWLLHWVASFDILLHVVHFSSTVINLSKNGSTLWRLTGDEQILTGQQNSTLTIRVKAGHAALWNRFETFHMLAQMILRCMYVENCSDNGE